MLLLEQRREEELTSHMYIHMYIPPRSQAISAKPAWCTEEKLGENREQNNVQAPAAWKSVACCMLYTYNIP